MSAWSPRGRLAREVAAVALLLMAAAASGQAPPGRWPFVEHAAETLGGFEIHSLAQDAQGFVWIGTTDGLYRYDGSRVEPIDMTSAFKSYVVQRLEATPDGGMWCITPVEARKWKDGGWLPLPEHQQPPGLFRTLAADPQSQAWIITDQGLFQEQPGGGFQPVPGWPGGEPRSLWIDTGGDVYVTVKGRLYRRGVDGSWKAWGPEVGVPDDRINVLGRGADGRLWLVSGVGVVVAVSPHSDHVEELPLGLSDMRRISDLQVVPWGGVWISTSQGIMEYDGRGPARPVRGSPSWVNGMLLDREGSVWAAGVGLQRLAGRGQWRMYTTHEGLPNDAVFPIQKDPTGRVWVGTLGGLGYSTPEGWQAAAELPKRFFHGLLLDGQGHLWMGGSEPGAVFRYALATREATRFPLEGGNGKEAVLKLALDGQGTLWAATTGGLFRAAAPERRFVRVPLPEDSGNPRLSGVMVDSAQRLWIGGFSALWVLEKGQARRFSTADGLRQQDVRELAEPQPGRICITYGVASGLDCFRYENGRLENVLHLDKSTGLTSDNIIMLKADSRGRLWVGTGRGLNRVDPTGIVKFRVADGLPSDDLNSQAFWEDADGVWVGTSKGLAHFRESAQASAPVPLHVILTRVRAGEQPVLPRQGAQELPYARNTLEFEWAAPTFTVGKDVVRQVRLVGLEADFRDEEHRARYVGLPPGHYEFQSRARRPQEDWGPVTRFAFVILPPWWMTWWFRVAVAMVAVGAVGGVVRWRQHALRARNEQLEGLVAQRTRELTEAQEQLVRMEKQATERRMAGGFAHEVRNALTGAKLLLGGVYHEDGRSLCEDNSQTLRELFLKFRQHLPAEQRQEVAGLIKQLNGNEEQLDGVLRDVDKALGRALGTTQVLLEYARTTRAQPGTEPVQALKLAEALVAEYREDFARQEIAVQLEVAEQTVLRGSEAHFLSMLKNLWLNSRDAVLEKPVGERRIRLAIREQGQGHVLEVEDSGPGIAPEHREAIFEPFFSTKPRTGTGLGLSVVQRLTSLYGGTIDVRSTVGVGTCFTLHLPQTGAPASAEDVRDQLGQGDQGGVQDRRRPA